VKREGDKGLTWFSLPHVLQKLEMACSLLLGAKNTVPEEVVDEELVTASVPTTGAVVCRKGGIAVIIETLLGGREMRVRGQGKKEKRNL